MMFGILIPNSFIGRLGLMYELRSARCAMIPLFAPEVAILLGF